MEAEQINKIQTFIADELARDGDLRCEQIELINGENLGRNPAPIRTWSHLALCRQSLGIAEEIMDTAKAVAVETGPGRHRFLIKSHLKDGGRQILWFTISSPREEETVSDPYRTSHPPEVKIGGDIADHILLCLERMLLDNPNESLHLMVCEQALRKAIDRAKEQPRPNDDAPTLMSSLARDWQTLREHGQKDERAQRITAMTATIAAGIWARNDPELDLGDADSKTIVAKLARATAELILQQETVDVR